MMIALKTKPIKPQPIPTLAWVPPLILGSSFIVLRAFRPVMKATIPITKPKQGMMEKMPK